MKVWKPKSVGSKITALVGVVAAIMGIILGVKTLVPDPEPPRLSVVFVLDVSSAMRKHLGGTTKLAAAQKTILENIASYPGISTSLRLVTASCDVTIPKPTVDFSTDNADRYKDVFRNLPAQSASSYFEGLKSAASDLTTTKLIQDSPQKLLVAFVADSNAKCGSPLSGFPIGGALVLQFFWLGGSGGELREVRKQLEALGFSDVTIQVVGTKKKLEAGVRHTVKFSSETPPPPPTESTPTESTPTESTTEPTTAIVPNIIGLEENQATATLRASFTPNIVEIDVENPSDDGIVQDQDPKGGTEAGAGSTVTITVGRYVVP